MGGGTGASRTGRDHCTLPAAVGINPQPVPMAWGEERRRASGDAAAEEEEEVAEAEEAEEEEDDGAARTGPPLRLSVCVYAEMPSSGEWKHVVDPRALVAALAHSSHSDDQKLRERLEAALSPLHDGGGAGATEEAGGEREEGGGEGGGGEPAAALAGAGGATGQGRGGRKERESPRRRNPWRDGRPNALVGGGVTGPAASHSGEVWAAAWAGAASVPWRSGGWSYARRHR